MYTISTALFNFNLIDFAAVLQLEGAINHRGLCTRKYIIEHDYFCNNM